MTQQSQKQEDNQDINYPSTQGFKVVRTLGACFAIYVLSNHPPLVAERLLHIHRNLCELRGTDMLFYDYWCTVPVPYKVPASVAVCQLAPQ